MATIFSPLRVHHIFYAKLKTQKFKFFKNCSWLFSILFLISIHTIFPSASFGQNSGKRAFAQAENLRKQNKYEEAVGEYNAAIEADGENYKYFFGKAMCEYKLQDMRSAKRSLERTIEFNKVFTPAYSMLAKIYRVEKDYDNAIFYYKEAANIESNDTRKLQYYLLVINLLMKEARVDEVRQHLATAQALDAEHPSLLYYQAELYAIENNWEQAKETYLAALASERMKAASSSDKVKYYYGLGLAYRRLGDVEKSDEVWENADFGPYKVLIEKEKEKNNYKHLYKIAVSYYLQGEYRESEKHIEDVLALKGQFVNAFVLKGKIAEKQGRMDEAVAAYQEAISLESDEGKAAKIRIMEANIHLDNQHGERALSALEPAVARYPNNTEWQYLKARAAYLANEYERAIQTIEVLLSGNIDKKTSAKYHFLLGMASKRSGNTEKARDAFKKALFGSYRDAARVELEKLDER